MTEFFLKFSVSDELLAEVPEYPEVLSLIEHEVIDRARAAVEKRGRELWPNKWESYVAPSD